MFNFLRACGFPFDRGFALMRSPLASGGRFLCSQRDVLFSRACEGREGNGKIEDVFLVLGELKNSTQFTRKVQENK